MDYEQYLPQMTRMFAERKYYQRKSARSAGTKRRIPINGFYFKKI